MAVTKRALLDVELSHSNMYRFLLIFINSVTLAGIYLSSVEWEIKWALVLLVGTVNGVSQWLTIQRGVTAVRTQGDSWSIRVKKNWYPATAVGHAFVSNYLVVLTLKRQSTLWYNNVFIFADSVNKKQFHQLKLLLMLDGVGAKIKHCHHR